MASSILVSCMIVEILSSSPGAQGQSGPDRAAPMQEEGSQMQYEMRYVAISTYYHDVLGVKMTKEEARRMGITLDKDEFLKVTMPLCHYAFIMPLCFHYAIMLSLCRCYHIGVMEKTSPGRHWWIFGVMRMEPGRL